MDDCNKDPATVAWQMFALIPAAILYGYYAGGGSAGAGAAVPIGEIGAAPVLASMGATSPVGGLSVPAGWAAATPDPGAATLAGSGWTAPPEEGMPMTNVAAGMPAVASAGRGGYGFSTPRYGVKPTVMPKSVLVVAKSGISLQAWPHTPTGVWRTFSFDRYPSARTWRQPDLQPTPSKHQAINGKSCSVI